jgi:hypothetical protein
VDARPNELQSPFLVKAHRLIVSVAILILLFVARIYAEGTYQRTDDRKKAFVWNNDPQSGDIATWTGERDAEGYAVGAGTLSWSRMIRGFSTGSNVSTAKKRTPISRYTGTMVHGKFEGVVTTIDRGKTYHAKFADGQRKGNWASGPAVAKAEKGESAPAVEKAERVQPAPPVLSGVEGSTTTASEPVIAEKIAEQKKPAPPAQTPEQTTTEDIPAAGPADEKAASSAQGSGVPQDASTQKSEVSSSAAESSKPATPLIAQASTTDPDESATPRQQPVTRKGALAPGAVRAIDKPTTTITAAPKKSKSTKQSSRTKTSEATTEKPKTTKPAPSQPAEATTQSSEDVPAAGRATSPIEKLEPPILKSEQHLSAPPSAKETPVDDSIKALTGPPSALRGKGAPPLPETNPPTQLPGTSNTAPSPSVAAAPKLTPVQAMDIADIEARTRGHDLGEYQLPKAEYNAANDSWSVAYVGRSADGTSKKLNVVVQDKTGKAEVKK